MEDLSTLRRAIEALSVNSYCRRYPAELRLRVAAHARRRMASGESLWSVAASLGMGGTTLRRILADGDVIRQELADSADRPAKWSKHRARLEDAV